MPRFSPRTLIAPLLCLSLAACGATMPSRPQSAAPKPAARAKQGYDGRLRLRLSHASLAVRLGRPRGALSRRALIAWVRRAAIMVSDYCGGRFPVREVEVDIVTRPWGRLGWGQHWGGRHVMAMAGGRTSLRGLRRDWVLVHEMLHLAFPRLPRRQRWMREGLSTYLETVVRARSGILSEREVWAKWYDSMPLGLARRGDRGFDITPSWRSTYWGGALFWLRVDVELRRSTDGRVSIRDLVRRLLSVGGNATQRWSVERLLRQADALTGTHVMSALYDDMARRPSTVDLDALFAELGVAPSARGVRLDDRAPLAAIRRAMVKRDGPRLPPIPGRD